jgi:hypothetical protein
LVAGVTAGVGIIKQAELSRIISKNSEFMVQYRTFKTTYGAVPGDFSAAFSLFGSATCANTSIHADVLGCNGDGNENLGGATGQEGQLLWKHLALSGLLPGNFTVVAAGATRVIGVNVPEGNVTGSGYYAAYDSYYGVVGTQDMFILGSTVANNDPYGAILKPSDAKVIDVKSDDGFPITGKVFSGTSPVGATGTCVNGSGSENLTNATEYVFSNTAIACRMIFLYGL